MKTLRLKPDPTPVAGPPTLIPTQTGRGDERSLRALAMLLLLAQLPHLLHLPPWVSLLGAAVVSARLLAHAQPQRRWLHYVLSPLSLSLLAVFSALLIRTHYGYFLGRDPCVAFLFLLVACKFAELRRARDATLLLCLAAFLLLTQYFYSQSIVSALITLPAVFALGNALAVLRDPTTARSTGKNMQLVGKLLLQGAPLAALLFIVFPRLPGPLWSLPEDSMATTGLSDSMEPGAISRLSQSDAVAFRVEFDGAPPPASTRYWRGPVLTDFDGRRWSVSPQLIEASPPLAGSQPLNYTVTLQPHRQRWLFALDMPVSLPMSLSPDARSTRALARLTLDGQLLHREPVSQVLRYRQQSQTGDSYRTARPPAASTLQLANKNRRTLAFAHDLRASVRSDQAYALEVLKHFNRENFHYTLQPSLLGHAPVDEFLFATREGFCEHYASAFVVMMRAAAIPARVVTGYLGGAMNGDYMIIRQSDAHAWAEAYIGGKWQRFDPTAAVAPSRVESGMASALADGEPIPRMARLNNDWLSRMQLHWDSINHDWQRLVIDFDNDTQATFWQRLGLPKPALWQITALVIVAAGFWSVVVLGFKPWRASSARMEERIWRHFYHLLNQHGVPRQAAEAPSDFLRRATDQLPAQAPLINRLGTALGKLRFTLLTDEERNSEWQTIRQALPRLYLALWARRLLPMRGSRMPQ